MNDMPVQFYWLVLVVGIGAVYLLLEDLRDWAEESEIFGYDEEEEK